MRKTWILLPFVACSFVSIGCSQDEAQPIQTTAEPVTQEQGAGLKLSKGKERVDLESSDTTLKRTDTEPSGSLTGTLAAASQARTQQGVAGYYHPRFHGQLTASGERYDQNALSAAHHNYPFGTKLRVTNLANVKSVEVRVNDRRASTPGRIIDLSRRAAEDIDLIQSGIAEVRLEVLVLGDGKTFHHPGIGTAAYYHARFNGRQTASGEQYNQNALTASHNEFPFGTKVRVTNLTNDKSVVVRINDRGPSTPGRIIDVSRRVAKELDFLKDGIAQVKLEVLKQGTS